MRYVIVCVLENEAGRFNNEMRQEIWEKFKARSSKLPAHFTIKSPFEYEGELTKIEAVLENFCQKEKSQPYKLQGYDHFDHRVIYMHVEMSEAGKALHDRLIETLMPYLNFNEQDGKDKIFHVTVASKKLQPLYEKVWDEVTQKPCEFNCEFDNICIYKWEDNTWLLYKAYYLR